VSLVVSQQGRELSVQIHDTGIGIEAELLPKIFDLFVQGTRGTDRHESGLGIGLTLVRSLVELHGGRVEVRSDGRGRGSVFSVFLQGDTEAQVAAASGAESRFEVLDEVTTPRRVVVVDDNKDACQMLADLLSLVGHQVKTAYDGPSGIRLIQAFKPDAAVLDIGLPGMTGHEVARQLRTLDDPNRKLHLIALTGYGQDSDKQLCVEAGFDAHFVKPIRLENLLRCISLGAAAPVE
jgi:CheY-like chemotaxis protein